MAFLVDAAAEAAEHLDTATIATTTSALCDQTGKNNNSIFHSRFAHTLELCLLVHTAFFAGLSS